MRFLNPWGWLALLAWVPVILLYLLKRQHEDRTVSSILLWREAQKDLQATRPWQRLRARLLLILQILAVALLSLSLARPVLSGGGGGVHYIAVMDTSARMQATDVSPSRIGRARMDLQDLIRDMRRKDTMTIVQAGIQPFVLVGPTGERGRLREYAGGIQATNGRSDLERAVQLARTLLQESKKEAGEIHLFSDKIPEGDRSLVSHVYSGNGQNSAVTHVSCEVRGGEMTVLSRVANYGDKRDLTLELKADGMRNNVREVSIPKQEEVSITWTGVPADTHTVEVSLSEKDDLQLDNRGWAVRKEEHPVRALMAAGRNVFLERALSLRSDMEVIKADPDDMPESGDYLLYLFDGALPHAIPESGNLMLFCPPSSKELGISAEGETVPSGITVRQQTIYPDLVEYLEPQGYQIAKARKYKVPKGMDILLEDQDGTPVLMAGEQNGRRIAIFSFSLSRSNLPMKPDFPILIQNLLNWMIPSNMDLPETISVGETLQLSPFPNTTGITVLSPSEKKYHLDAEPDPVFYDTYDPGVYKVTQKTDRQTEQERFVVSVPTEEVSDLRAETRAAVPSSENGIRKKGTTAARGVSFHREIWTVSGWVLLVLLLTEWWVYHREI